MRRQSLVGRWNVAACLLMFVISTSSIGCGGSKGTGSTAAQNQGETKGGRSTHTDASSRESDTSEPVTADSTPKPKFEAVTLRAGSEPEAADEGSTTSTNERKADSVVAAMQPLQIMLGKWRGTTNQKFKGFSAIEEVEWVWDFRTDRAQPALVLKSDKSPYMRTGRLTFLPAQQEFRLDLQTPEGDTRVLQGTFEREPEEFTGDDNKPQRSYRLVLTETEPMGNEAWQVAFEQQENNRYLVQVSRKRGSGSYQLADTVGTQRIGTSFAASDEDYGDKKCIISGGLGVTTVSYNGKSYWVCCSGCQAAFNEDPARWVAKREAAEKNGQK